MITTEQSTYTYTDDSGYADSLENNTVEGTYYYFDESEDYYVFVPADPKFYTVIHEGHSYTYAQESGLTPQDALEMMEEAYS